MSATDSPKPSLTHEVLLKRVIDLAAITVDDKRAKIESDTILFTSSKTFDSFALLELVMRLESSFGLNIPDEDLDRDSFKSPGTIVEYLRGRLASD